MGTAYVLLRTFPAIEQAPQIPGEPFPRRRRPQPRSRRHRPLRNPETLATHFRDLFLRANFPAFERRIDCQQGNPDSYAKVIIIIYVFLLLNILFLLVILNFFW